jgi:outer membrane receptor protein involved in Fe transport
VKLWKNLTATLGLSFDSYQRTGFRRNQLNPKVGINWQILPSTLIRAAAFQTIKRPLSSNQTLEPTQVAGFNQFFDDYNGSKTKRYGVAIDHQINASLFAGLEASLREIDYPNEITKASIKVFTNREQLYRTYLLWTPFETLALKTAYDFEQLKRNPDVDSNNPIMVKTHRLPITFNYYHPNGFFTKLGATFVEQRVKYQSDTKNPLQSGNNHFWVLDAAIGYRLPKRWGILSFGIKNLLNEQFNFEEVNTTTGATVATQFQPDRMLFGQITLSY